MVRQSYLGEWRLIFPLTCFKTPPSKDHFFKRIKICRRLRSPTKRKTFPSSHSWRLDVYWFCSSAKNVFYSLEEGWREKEWKLVFHSKTTYAFTRNGMLGSGLERSAWTRQVAPETGVNQKMFLSRKIMFNLKPLYIECANKYADNLVLCWISSVLCCDQMSTT